MDLASQAGQVHDLRSESIEQARSFFGQDARKADARGAFLLGARCLLPSGALLGVVNPVRRTAGLRLCAFDRLGAELNRFWAELPDSGKRPGLPRFMAPAGENVLLIYPKGMADSYLMRV